jgi:hypothetical protein
LGPNFASRWKGQPVRLQAAVGGHSLSCHDADLRGSHAQMNCVAARWGQATPGQDGDEIAWHHLPGYLLLKCLRGDTPTMIPPLFFLFLMDVCSITSGILPNSTPNFPLQSSHVSRDRLVHFLFHVPQKKEIPWVAPRWEGGRCVPPQALDDMCPVLVSSHSITILAWYGSAPACCHKVLPYLAIPIQSLRHGREGIVLQLVFVAEVIYPIIFWQKLGPKMLIYI